MASKFYAGMKNVVEALNEMWTAFAVGPYNSLPLSGGTLTGPLTVNAAVTANSMAVSSARTYSLVGSPVGTGDGAAQWYKLGRLSGVTPSAGRIVIGGTNGYGAGGNSSSSAGVSTIHFRSESDSILRGFIYSETSGSPAVYAAVIDSQKDVYVQLGAFFSGDMQVFGQFGFAPSFAIFGPNPPAGQSMLPRHATMLGGVAAVTIDPNYVTFGIPIASKHVVPIADNVSDVGSASVAYRTIYARTGTINPSDARLKTDFRFLTPAEIVAARDIARAIGIYRWRDAVDSKGDAAREHVGPTVQAAIEIMQAHDLDPFGYGFICHDSWERQVVEHAAVEAHAAVPPIEAAPAVLDSLGNLVTAAVPASPGYPAIEARAAYTEVVLEAGDRYAFRYDELAMFIVAGQEARLAELEAAK